MNCKHVLLTVFSVFLFGTRLLAQNTFPTPQELEKWVFEKVTCEGKKTDDWITEVIDPKRELVILYKCSTTPRIVPLQIKTKFSSFLFSTSLYKNKPIGFAFLTTYPVAGFYWDGPKLKALTTLPQIQRVALEKKPMTGAFSIVSAQIGRLEVLNLKNGVQDGMQATLNISKNTPYQADPNRTYIGLSIYDNGKLIDTGQFNVTSLDIFNSLAPAVSVEHKVKRDGMLGLTGELGSRKNRSIELFYSPNFRVQDIGGGGYYGSLGQLTYQETSMYKATVGVGFIAMFMTGFAAVGGQFGKKEYEGYDIAIGAGVLVASAYAKLSYLTEPKSTVGEVGVRVFIPLLF